MLNLNISIVFTRAELSTIATVAAAHVTGKDRWNDSRVKKIKHRISKVCLNEQNCYCAFCEGILKKGDAPIEHISPKP